MFNEIKIGSKISVLLLGVVTIVILSITFLSYRFGKDSFEQGFLQALNVKSSIISSQLDDMFEQLEYNLRMIQSSNRVLQSLMQASTINNVDSAYFVIEKRLNDYLVPIQEIYGYNNILLLNTQGLIIYKTNKNLDNLLVGENFPDYDQIKLNASKKIYYGAINKVSEKKALLNVAIPVFDLNEQLIGHVIAEFDMAKVYRLTSDTLGLGRTGEVIISRLSGNKIDYLNKPRLSSFPLLTQSSIVDENNPDPIYLAAIGESGFGLMQDYRDKKALAVWRHLPRVNWGIIVKMDQEELNKRLDVLLMSFLFAAVFILLVAFAISLIFSNYLTTPLQSLKAILSLVAQGILPEKVAIQSRDEIGEMAIAVSNLVSTLRNHADFARKIGEGQYDVAFQPASANDVLGNALITMRDNIKRAEQRDEERNWIVSGVAEVGQILRSGNSLQEVGYEVLAYIVQKIEAVQGAFYVVNEQADGQSLIELIASYAYAKRKYLKSTFRIGEGLVGQAVIEQDTILRTEIPAHYMTISSGILGDRKPECLLLVPLITNETVYGVLELAGFERFNEVEIKFVEEISAITARTIFNIKVNERTLRLLTEAQQMSEELQAREKTLRENAVIMEATQEELRRINARLEEQVQEVNRSQKRMQLLLENASEVITIYEQDGYIRYISPSVESILGYTQEEMIGINDIIYVHPNSVATARQMFQSLLENPEEKVMVQFEYLRKNGEAIWLEATGNNLLSDPAIRGIVVNYRDITERLLAEREARMRGQMQALSENSPDLITRINPEGKLFYINPVITSYTGKMPSELLGKRIQETGLHEELIKQWSNLLHNAIAANRIIKTEMNFPSLSGNRIMQVNAIPEQNENQEIESVLIVSHDITEMKEAEMEILSINRKITESINYAKRIQSAILPDTATIQRILPDSFIYYRPRDVVSGDFPWFLQKGSDIYIAAVDCTGHGVPGALISLIGYFILNDVVNSQHAAHVGQILDLLNEGVTRTLRQQDVNATTRDGMDIALCKINLLSRKVQYAGAHRPLYYVTNGELKVLKGDKFPIGGGQIRNRISFSSHEFTVSKGDSLYLFSDGLADQFGGPDNRKFSPRQIRELISTHHHKPMNEIRRIFDQAFESWRNGHMQTDDILLIGIKF
ncbi:MAG: PAS domain S-box protein [Cytophagales bacterium]|nr:PAS domain S-box protein [Bernardetiaceae bacterium]MDW8203909.1 PAS domain S-box protein [Cytophagales bacterium]